METGTGHKENMTEPFSDNAFAQQTVLITGATGGIGAVCAQMFYDAGATVVLCDVDPATLDTFAASFEDEDRAHTCSGDVTDPNVIESITAQIKHLKGVDHLILAAGIYKAQPLESMTNDQFDQTLNINLRSVFQLCRALLPWIIDNGSIVNFTSIAGQRGSKNHAHYAATKAALVAFGRSLAWEVGPRNIRVNAVSPGIIATTMTEELIATNHDTLIQTTPLQRYGQASEVASAVVFLASSAASFITGVNLEVNGGLHMG